MNFFDKLDDIQKKIIALYVLLICIAILIYIFIVVSGKPFYCPIHKATGLYCPGCGITRSCTSLMHFQVYKSFRYHPGFFIGSLTWIIISIFAFIGKPKCFRNSKVLLPILYITLGLYIIFSIIRNIPGFEFLTPMGAV